MKGDPAEIKRDHAISGKWYVLIWPGAREMYVWEDGIARLFTYRNHADERPSGLFNSREAAEHALATHLLMDSPTDKGVVTR